MIFRLTKKVQTHLKNPDLQPIEAENRYCEWFVSLFNCDRKKYFIITNAYSLLSVIFPAKGITSVTAFYERAGTELKTYFEAAGIANLFADHIQPHMDTIHVSATNSKSVLATMNAFIRNTPYYIAFKDTLFDAMQSLNTYPISLVEEFKGSGTAITAICSDGMKKPVRAYHGETEKQKKQTTKSVPYKNEFGDVLTDPKAIAQDLCWTAWDTDPTTKEGRKERKELIEEALAYNPNCTDAYCLLAENTRTYPQQLKYAKKAKEAFEKDYGEQFIKENMGYFYGILETRPYMRALWYYSEALIELGHEKAAINIMEYMLDLCTNDNMGVRFELAEIYRRHKDKQALEKLNKRFQAQEEAYGFSDAVDE